MRGKHSYLIYISNVKKCRTLTGVKARDTNVKTHSFLLPDNFDHPNIHGNIIQVRYFLRVTPSFH